MRAATIRLLNRLSARRAAPSGPAGLSGLLLGGTLLVVPLSALAASLNGISYTALPGDRVQVELELSDPVTAEPLNFTIDNPARVALDFPATTLNVPVKTQTIGVGKVESVTAVEAEGRTRVVMNLVQVVPYSLKTEGNKVKVVLEGVPADITADVRPTLAGTATTMTPAATTATPAASVTMPGNAAGESIRALDFRRGDAGEAQIVVDLGGVSFIDSSGLSALVLGMKRCRENEGDLRLCRLQTPVRMIFELTRLHQAFEIHGDEGAAVRAFARA